LTAPNVGLWQIYFKPEQAGILDPLFTPLDNISHHDEALEFAVFLRLQASGQTQPFGRWGALSWKFTQKTGMTGQGLLEAVHQAPDVDVFYMNPYPYNEALHVSPWWQGEVAHPDFLRVSVAFLTAAGLDSRICHRLTPGSEFSMCNYFVGTARFWERYLGFVERALALAEQHMPEDLRRKMHTADADWRGMHHQSTYVPFVVERLFGVFLHTEAGKGLKARQLPCPLGEAGMDAELTHLREAKRVALMTKSARVLQDWQRMRKLYFERRYGAAWCQRYLERVMSAEVLF
jgi:hypothetical protein